MDVVMTNDDVLGDEIPNDQLDALRQFCNQTLKLNVPVILLCLSLNFFYDILDLV
jgi:hypothetical protein